MANRFRPVTVRPANGGRLMATLSPDGVPIADYTIKRDWRRDLDKEARREGNYPFWPNREIEQGDQPFPEGDPGTDPIMLIHRARRPNGKTAVIAGTRGKLFRYFGMENGAYFSTDPADYPSGQIPAYFTPNVSPNNPPFTPYFDDDPGVWIEIGSGFSTLGHRWEAVDLNGYVIFNNGVDLPVTYRLEDLVVEPMYELREQGIASVGTIEVINGRLMLGDIRELVDIGDVLDPIPSGVITGSQAGATYSGMITASQAVNTVTSSAAFFDAGMVGYVIRFSDGRRRTISVFLSPTQVTVAGAASTVTARPFFITQEILFSEGIESSQTGATVTADGAIFTAHMATDGWFVRWDDGNIAQITGFTSALAVTVNPAQTVTTQPFRIVPPEFVVTSSGYAFTADYVGQRILFADGAVRRITDYFAPTIALVSFDVAVASQIFSIENPTAYALVPDTILTNRISFRVLWSEQDEPRKFALALSGGIVAGSNRLRLERPTRSFEFGDEIVVTGAGIAGGNLSATIAFVAEMGTVLILNTVAVTTVAQFDAVVSRLSSIGSGVGYTDLQDDGSGVLRMLGLRGVTLVIYKETSIFIGTFTGDPAGLFTFSKVCATENSVYFRWTLIQVKEQFHVYAGRTSFFKFDLTNRLPQEVQEGEFVKSLFFTVASIEDSDFIFSADNAVTDEIMMFFPNDTEDQCLAFDYRMNTVSTSSEYFSAAAMVKRPLTGIELINEDWFLLGTLTGKVLQYGLVSGPDRISGAITGSQSGTVVTASGNFFSNQDIGKTLRYADGTGVAIIEYISPTQINSDTDQVRGAQRFSILPAVWNRDGAEYESVLQSGLGSLGDDFDEKTINGYVLYLAGQSPHSPITVVIRGAVNSADGETILATNVFNEAQRQNLLPLYFTQNYFQDVVTVDGKNNPVLIAARSYLVLGVRSQSFVRAE